MDRQEVNQWWERKQQLQQSLKPQIQSTEEKKEEPKLIEKIEKLANDLKMLAEELKKLQKETKDEGDTGKNPEESGKNEPIDGGLSKSEPCSIDVNAEQNKGS